MRRQNYLLIWVAAAGVWTCGNGLSAADHGCPLLPRESREKHQEARGRERGFQTYSRSLKPAPTVRAAAPVNNFIDQHLFAKMARDAVEPAPLADDYEFLRRAMLDLTGRIPAPGQIQEFVKDERADKRTRLIDSLIGSPAYVDHWTLYFGNRFQVTSGYYQLVGIPGRNLFHFYLRDFVADDRPWRDLAAELITATGDTHRAAPGNLLMRGMQQGDPIQDTWDTLTNTVTSEFLGVQTQCVSCHDGRRHLEEINLYLVRRRREEFMQQSAFFARMQVNTVPVDAFNQQSRGLISDRTTGVYHGVVNPQNPGARPARIGTYEPVYLFTGEKARNGDWRRELARMVTGDRQFARAAVNYIWAHLFRAGIVDPPNAWDLARIDAKNPPPAPWPLQPSHPELLEELADFFIANQYRFRPLIRLIAESSAYQLATRYPGNWRPEYAQYFAKHTPRRMSAEEIYDAMVISTLTEAPMNVEGFDKPVQYASQLPDPTEPRGRGSIPQIGAFLANFGRGDWWQVPRTSEGSVVQVLYLMNDGFPVQRTLGLQSGGGTPWFGNTRVSKVLASTMSDDEAVAHLFLASLGRPPSDEERAVVIKRRTNDRDRWLSDLHWALINRAEFLFN